MSLHVKQFDIVNLCQQQQASKLRTVKVRAVSRSRPAPVLTRRSMFRLGLHTAGVAGVLSTLPGPSWADLAADETDELAEKAIPELEEEIGNIDAPPAVKQALEKELGEIENEVSKVEVDITRGVNEEEVEEEVGGLEEQVKAFKSLLGF
ncbi:hypothetical protein BSKO_01988 [Bryopsis sp. KO-2023]|nr:hypothetical protein BSKO_01988 [Bryopsis sp. KO-2023]